MKNKFLQLLGLTKKAGKLLEGYNKCEEGIKSNNVKLIIISDEVSQNTKDKFSGYCNRNEIFLITNVDGKELSNILGICKIGVLGVTDLKLSQSLFKLWNDQINI